MRFLVDLQLTITAANLPPTAVPRVKSEESLPEPFRIPSNEDRKDVHTDVGSRKVPASEHYHDQKFPTSLADNCREGNHRRFDSRAQKDATRVAKLFRATNLKPVVDSPVAFVHHDREVRRIIAPVRLKATLRYRLAVKRLRAHEHNGN